jgi:hypothetical protein
MGVGVVDEASGKALSLHYNTQAGNGGVEVTYVSSLTQYGTVAEWLGRVAPGVLLRPNLL